MEEKYTAIPSNYKHQVEWIIGAYENAGVEFSEGFQKDVVQNAVGARKTDKWDNWACKIDVVNNSKGTFLVIEDCGTVGLTGKNYVIDDINGMMEKNVNLAPEERLARFSSMFNSGGNTTGGGLYGAGKTVYSVASKDYIYYFDSLRNDGLYVSNVNKVGRLLDKAKEGEEAKSFILQETGLEPKKTVGTRVIIVSPKQELLRDIKDGSFESYIQESWWLILNRLPASSGIFLNGKRITCPENIYPSNDKYCYDLEKAEKYDDGYTVKHFGLYYFDENESPWQGICYYRKGMKIGKVDIRDKDFPAKTEGKYWGYIEVDKLWEELLAEIEDIVHFGVSSGKKKTTIYQNLKNYCNAKVKEQFIKWGLIKSKQYEDQKLQNMLSDIQDEIQNLFDKEGYESLGNGPKKPDFNVRWQNVHYPEINSEHVTDGDIISFTIRVTSAYEVSKRFEYDLKIIEPKENKVVSTIESDKVAVDPYGVFTKDFKIEINDKVASQFIENRIVLRVKPVGSGKEKRKELPFFYDIEKPDNSRETVKLTLHECEMPTPESRRVNFGESIRNVCYRIENKRNCTLGYQLSVGINNISDSTRPQIKKLETIKGTIGPFEEEVTDYLEPIEFNEDYFGQYLQSGILELRAKLSATESDEFYEKGSKITSYNFIIHLNSDEKHGKDNSFKTATIYDPTDYRRSYNETGNNRQIVINTGHSAYQDLKDYEELQRKYLHEQMLKQCVLLYMSEGKTDMFNSLGKEFNSLEQSEAVDTVVDEIEKMYYKSLNEE